MGGNLDFLVETLSTNKNLELRLEVELVRGGSQIEEKKEQKKKFAKKTSYRPRWPFKNKKVKISESRRKKRDLEAEGKARSTKKMAKKKSRNWLYLGKRREDQTVPATTKSKGQGD